MEEGRGEMVEQVLLFFHCLSFSPLSHLTVTSELTLSRHTVCAATAEVSMLHAPFVGCVSVCMFNTQGCMLFYVYLGVCMHFFFSTSSFHPHTWQMHAGVDEYPYQTGMERKRKKNKDRDRDRERGRNEAKEPCELGKVCCICSAVREWERGMPCFMSL